jgi:hypothetical protein
MTFHISALALALAGSMLSAPASAQKMPSPVAMVAWIKATMLTLNDANVTGNYAVLHAKLSKPFRDQFGPDKLKETFKSFADQQIDYDIIAAFKPVATQEPKIDDRGALVLRGHFDTRPNRVTYELDFIPSDGEWKPIKLQVNVNAAPVEQN